MVEKLRSSFFSKSHYIKTRRGRGSLLSSKNVFFKTETGKSKEGGFGEVIEITFSESRPVLKHKVSDFFESVMIDWLSIDQIPKVKCRSASLIFSRRFY